MTNCATETSWSHLHPVPDWESLLPTEREELLRGSARRIHHSVRARISRLALRPRPRFGNTPGRLIGA